jgi:uncharacterized repeat protein (TIGR03803 family)
LGGKYNQGIVFKITPSGKLTVLYNFDSTHGSASFPPLIQGSDGDFYGTTIGGGSAGGGIAFKITPTGKLTVLANLGSGSGPAVPYAGLVQATDGLFYGNTYQGGTMGDGTIFRLSAKGVTFGGVKSTSFTVKSDTEVMATVPTGAKTGHIGITTAGGTVFSSGIFTVTN